MGRHHASTRAGARCTATGPRHDALFKSTFGMPEHASGLLRGMLPDRVVRVVDWGTLRRCPGSFVDDDLREEHADLLFEARIAGRRSFLYLLLEHKSYQEPFLALHLLRYLVRVWDRWRRERPRRRLPVIVPLVVHHGNQGWRGSTRFRDLLDLAGLPEDAATALLPHLPDFRFVLDHLAAATEADLRDRVVSAVARLTLLFLQHIRSSEPPDAVAKIARWADVVQNVLGTPGGQEALGVLWSYLLSVTETEPEHLRIVLARIDDQAEDTLMSTAERIAKKAREEGIERGIERGIARGRADLLLRMLEARFGPVPAALEQHVRSADGPTIER